jgi:hypothetical protein
VERLRKRAGIHRPFVVRKLSDLDASARVADLNEEQKGELCDRRVGAIRALWSL